MIPRNVLAAWRHQSPWRTDRQVEQDLVLQALAIEVAQHDVLRNHLIWRGGTCLHKLHLDDARRYSEDLDYVLLPGVGHGEIKRALTQVAERIGLTAGRYEVSDSRVKLWAEAEATAVPGTVSVKFEVNCNDAPPLFELVRIPMELDTRWWSGAADVLTFDASELLGSKFRALAQRRKGRDLSDLWLARRELPITDTSLATAADHYLNHDQIAPSQLRARLAEHERDPEFTSDLDVLTARPYDGFDAVDAVRRLILWADMHLDPLHDARRNPNAVRRDRQQREKDGWQPGMQQCPVYLERGGNLTRCSNWVAVRGVCPDHTDAPTTP